MMIELKADQFDRVRCLFQETDYSLSILAAIEGNNPGRIFVDDIEHPKTSLGLTVEGYLLVGDHSNPEKIQHWADCSRSGSSPERCLLTVTRPCLWQSIRGRGWKNYRR